MLRLLSPETFRDKDCYTSTPRPSMEPTQQTTTSSKAKSGWLKQLVLILGLFFVAAVVLPAIFMPWAFFMGGSFHMLPTWQGWGRMHSKTAGGDYVIRISMYPKTGRRVGYTHVRGTAWLCTPARRKLLSQSGRRLSKRPSTQYRRQDGPLLYVQQRHQEPFHRRPPP